MAQVRKRKALSRFAHHMKLRLRENDYKGREGWRGWSRRTLTTKLMEEVIELSAAKDDDSRMQECCDIANFAMMIFDNIDKSKGH